MSNVRACYDVRSVFEVHLIADTVSFSEQNCLQVTKASFKRSLQPSNSKKLFLIIYIDNASWSCRVVDLELPGMAGILYTLWWRRNERRAWGYGWPG